jgi:flagellar biosynthetic protein FliS
MYKLFLVLFLSTAAFAELIDGVAVTVEGSPITLYEIKEEMKLSKTNAKQAKNILIRKKLEELEIQERGIKVSSGEVYEDIKDTAGRNNMSISAFYEAVRNSSGLTSTQLKEKIKEKDYENKAKAIIKAQDIIKELMCSLNFEKGGEIANNLDSLYNYMLRRILQGDLNKDVRPIDEVIEMFTELLSAWEEVALKPENQVQTAEDNLYREKIAAGSGYISV